MSPEVTHVKLRAKYAPPNRGSVTVSPGDGRIVPSFRDREHSSTVSGMFDFSRSGSAEAPPDRRAEAPPSSRAERPQEPPTTSTPTE